MLGIAACEPTLMKTLSPVSRRVPPSLRLDLERLRRHEVSAAHDQFGAARLEGRKVEGDLSLDHVALALAHLRHVGRDRAGDHRAELRRVPGQPGDACAPDFVLAGHAGDVGTGTSDVSPLDEDHPLPGSRQVPRKEISARTTAKKQGIKMFRLSHVHLHVRGFTGCTPSAAKDGRPEGSTR